MTGLLDDRDELLGRIPVDQLFAEMGIPSRGKTWGCPNPEHPQTGRTPPVSLDVVRGLFACHGCGAGGSAVDALRLAKGLSVAEAFAWLRERAKLHRPEPVRPTASRQPSAAVAHPDAGKVLARFCRGRGWRPEVAERCGLHVVLHRTGRPMVRFPFRRDGRCDWWQDREVGDRLPKFDSPFGMASTVWAVDLAHGLRCAHVERQAIVVEGPCDGVALAHCADPDGYPAVFALPGTGSSAALIGRLDTALAGLEVVILVDEDDPGEKFRSRLHDLLISPELLVDVRVPAGCGDVDGWRRHLRHDDDALALAIAHQVAAAERRVDR